MCNLFKHFGLVVLILILYPSHSQAGKKEENPTETIVITAERDANGNWIYIPVDNSDPTEAPPSGPNTPPR